MIIDLALTNYAIVTTVVGECYARIEGQTNSIERYIFESAFNLELHFIVCTTIIVLIYNNNSINIQQ